MVPGRNPQHPTRAAADCRKCNIEGGDCENAAARCRDIDLAEVNSRFDYFAAWSPAEQPGY
jgi:hypothetical protein